MSCARRIRGGEGGEGEPSPLRVVARTSNRMRHVGPFLDISATNRMVEFSAFWSFRITGGQIEEIWPLDQDFTLKLR